MVTLGKAGPSSSSESKANTTVRRMARYCTEEISVVNADWLLILLSLGTGVIDAFTFVDLEVFAANMTGNAVFLALSAAQVQYSFISAPRSIVALATFWAGSFISGQLGQIIGPRKRWWLFVTLLVQGLLVLLAAILLWTRVISGQEISTLSDNVLGFIALLSFTYGAQATTARGLQVPEIPSVVLTSAMVDLMNDPKIFRLQNRPRNRRLGTILAIFLGAFIGGWVHNRVNRALNTAIAGIIKLISAGLILLFESKEHAQARIKISQERKSSAVRATPRGNV